MIFNLARTLRLELALPEKSDFSVQPVLSVSVVGFSDIR
jgi:hypothetical protein